MIREFLDAVDAPQCAPALRGAGVCRTPQTGVSRVSRVSKPIYPTAVLRLFWTPLARCGMSRANRYVQNSRAQCKGGVPAW